MVSKIVAGLLMLLGNMCFELKISCVNEENYELIRPGMTEAQVRERLGDPLPEYPVGWAVVERRLSSTRDLDRIDEIDSGRCKVWIGDKVAIFVFFDNASSVSSTEIERAVILKSDRVKDLADILYALKQLTEKATR